MDVLLAQLVTLLQLGVTKYPWLATLLMVVGVLRLVFKPFFSFLHTVVDATSSTKDNEYLDKVERSTAYKVMSYVLDWLGSIKLQSPGK